MNKEDIMNRKSKKIKKISPLFIVIGIVAAVYVIFLLYLILWGFGSSVKATLGLKNVFRDNMSGFPKGWPWEWEWSNYQKILKYLYVDVWGRDGRFVRTTFLGLVLNSVLYAVGGAFVATLIPFIMAYATTKVNYKFNVVIDTIVVVCMAIPIVGSQPSEIQVLKTLGLFDNWAGFFIQKGHFLSMYYLVFQATFRSISKEYTEAARIDGAGYYKTMIRIIMPLAKTIFFTVVMLHFITFWNDYSYNLIYLRSKPTLAYGVYFLVYLNTENALANVPMRMCSSFILFIPILLLFLCFKNVFMQNLSMGGVKE